MLDENTKQRFTEIVGVDNFFDSPSEMLTYSYDGTPEFQSMPDGVIAPRNTEEIASVVKVCSEKEIPIVPRGSGTNLSAGTCPTSGGIVLLFKHLNRIKEIDEDNLTVTVEPGVITLDMIHAVEARGLFYPPDPSSMKISTIGGNVSENSGGLRGLKYGVTKDYVLGMTVVVANGDIIHLGGKLTKDVAGYDLKSLFVGAEGTLGIVTEVILKLIPIPETKQTVLAVYDDIQAAADSVSAIISNKIIPATLEFLDQGTIRVVEDFAHVGLPTEASAILLIEQDGPEAVVASDIEKITAVCKENKAVSVQAAATEEEAEGLRTARRSALAALARLRPTTILEDATVPRSMVAPMVKAINEIAEKYQVTICTFGHAGDGNLHPTCLTDARDKEEMERVEKAFADIFQTSIDMGGTITGEHGVGEMKAPYLHLKLGQEGIAAMQAVKTGLDPKNIMNPKKIFGEVKPKEVTS
ncbi:glycolate oxidase [Sinobaca qinghaiensis]|uniref:Glycolate oxidase n=1 Tax=Sinobaca qinghaiensis TaxID=342944 RepID=A0A419V4Y7_9BACL|nr:glycolate oxidase subunit GlcD [Sinobaca qinghaiensis]RKD73555.1 glycolate oxidase [Sinobaca qinghaiensis]